MTIKILDLAERDLIEGFRFYEAQEVSLGSYFLTNLYADIESLRLYAGLHERPSRITIACFLIDSLLPFSISTRKSRVNSCCRRLSARSRLDPEATLVITASLTPCLN